MKKKDLQMEKMTFEMIRFLQKWGLWQDVSIFSNGNMYSYSSDKEKKYRGISGVVFESDANPEEAMKGITGQRDGEGKLIWKSFANPKHIFDMTYEGPLSLLICYGEYEPNKREINLSELENFIDQEVLFDDFALGMYLPEIAGHIKEEFSSIFEKYGLWYDCCFDWSLTAYRTSSKS